MEGNTKDLVYSRNVIEFATVAKEFCAFIENIENLKRKAFVTASSKFLPLLYYKASLLPSTEPFYEEGVQKHVSEDDYETLRLKLKAFLGEHDEFPEAFDIRILETDDQFNATISEYLSDVYQDLKNFTLIYQQGQIEEMNDAIWECRLNFEEYWGIRLANCIRAMHILCYGKIDIDEDADREAKSDIKQPDTSKWFIAQRQKDTENEF